jgi:hypothetical protein
MNWQKKVYLDTIEWDSPTYIVALSYEDFDSWDMCRVSKYRQIREIPRLITITHNWQEIEISQEKAKELWFKI